MERPSYFRVVIFFNITKLLNNTKKLSNNQPTLSNNLLDMGTYSTFEVHPGTQKMLEACSNFSGVCTYFLFRIICEI